MCWTPWAWRRRSASSSTTSSTTCVPPRPSAWSRLRAEAPGAPPRRVVLAAELPDDLVSYQRGDAAMATEGERALVRLASPVPLKKVASGHVDDVVASPAVKAALEALAAA